MHRTHTCGELTAAHEGREATLSGWVHSVRDHGGLIFIDLRDRFGLTQVVVNPAHASGAHVAASGLRPEDVIQARGKVARRSPQAVNPKLPTGEVELAAAELQVLSRAQTLPFPIEDAAPSEELRLKYRYLDLRRPPMQRIVELRHKVALAIRNFLDRERFLEIETPFLYKSTPEGAREFLVPSRLNPGQFYALPQSPQVFKQILMMAGMDRYFQIVRCFRDEDLRADRQPEFTQLDLEMSFVHQDDVLSLVERLFAAVIEEATGTKIPVPFHRLRYADAMAWYGSDKPDLRIDWKIRNVTGVAAQGDFRVFKEAAAGGGSVQALRIPQGGVKISRMQVDKLVERATQLGAKGLAWVKIEPGKWSGPVAKFFPGPAQEALTRELELAEGDLVLFAADSPMKACGLLGVLRDEIAQAVGAVKPGLAFTWVLEFPLFFRSEEEGKLVSGQHPFTAPHPDDLAKLDSDPLSARSLQHDLVLNGHEVAGGSIRLHEWELQSKAFRLLGMTDEQAKEKFGFLLEALQSGAPPHGGIAAGVDRFVAILAGVDNIREVIAFPKTHKGTCLMTGSPSPAHPRQLADLHVGIVEKKGHHA